MTVQVFQNRAEAGRALGDALGILRNEDVLVVGIPRGGVVVAAEVARVLRSPLETVVVRKIENPIQPEASFGVVAEGGVEIIEPDAARMLGLQESSVRSLIEAQRAPLGRRAQRYGMRTTDLRGRRVVLVDEGITSGLTMSAAISSMRRRRAERVIVAVPVASRRALNHITELADEVVCMTVPASFSSVGQWYREFEPITDAEALAALSRAGSPPPVSPHMYG